MGELHNKKGPLKESSSTDPDTYRSGWQVLALVGASIMTSTTSNRQKGYAGRGLGVLTDYRFKSSVYMFWWGWQLFRWVLSSSRTPYLETQGQMRMPLCKRGWVIKSWEIKSHEKQMTLRHALGKFLKNDNKNKDFIKVWLVYKTLYILYTYNLMSLEGKFLLNIFIVPLILSITH